jgi:hypothetical protein
MANKSNVVAYNCNDYGFFEKGFASYFENYGLTFVSEPDISGDMRYFAKVYHHNRGATVVVQGAPINTITIAGKPVQISSAKKSLEKIVGKRQLKKTSPPIEIPIIRIGLGD